MKKLYCFLLTLTLLFTVSIPAHASETEFYIVNIEDLGNGYHGVTTITGSTISPLSLIGHKDGSKTYNITNSSGDIVASFTLKASFTYDTSGSAFCDSATYTTTVNKKGWSFSEAKAYRVGNTAYGEFTAIYKILGITTETVTKTLTISCDRLGNLS